MADADTQPKKSRAEKRYPTLKTQPNRFMDEVDDIEHRRDLSYQYKKDVRAQSTAQRQRLASQPDRYMDSRVADKKAADAEYDTPEAKLKRDVDSEAFRMQTQGKSPDEIRAMQRKRGVIK